MFRPRLHKLSNIAAIYSATTGGGGGGKVLTFRSIDGTGDSGNNPVNFTTTNIGTATADRLVIVALYSQNNPTLTSVTVGGVGLTPITSSILGGQGLALYAGLVTTGSGIQTIAVTQSSAAFSEMCMCCWTMTGLTSNTSKHSVNGAAPLSIGVTALDLMVAANFNGGNAWTGTTQTPSATHTVTGINGGVLSTAEWSSITSTNAAFAIDDGTGAFEMLAGSWA